MLRPIWDAFSGENMLESMFVKEGFQIGLISPKAFPSGGRWAGEAGSDEGAIWYPTFPCKKKALSQLSPQRGFSIAPLGNPVAPSLVTSGDSFPPRGSLWVV